MNLLLPITEYFYTYVRHRDEIDLARFEMRAFFQKDTQNNWLFSSTKIDLNRSPFIKERISCWYKTTTLEDLCMFASTIQIPTGTFKIHCLNDRAYGTTAKFTLNERRKMEQTVAYVIQGVPELFTPTYLIGIALIEGEWIIGPYETSESIWYQHRQKPNGYSTALSTKLARTIANIAAPKIEGVTMIDPCCGIGTVLIEARSMGMNIVGRDINWLMMEPIQENLAHFNLTCDVKRQAIEEITETYDVAIIDLPYNIFLKTTLEIQLGIIAAGMKIAPRLVIVTIDTIDDALQELGLQIIDRCVAHKGHFTRQILLCEVPTF